MKWAGVIPLFSVPVFMIILFHSGKGLLATVFWKFLQAEWWENRAKDQLKACEWWLSDERCLVDKEGTCQEALWGEKIKGK